KAATKARQRRASGNHSTYRPRAPGPQESITRHQFLAQPLHPPEVTAAPIRLSAPGTAPKPLVVQPRLRLEPIQHRLLRHVLEHAVASQAARERPYRPLQLQAREYLAHLLARPVRAHEIAVRDDLVLQERPVAGEHDAPLLVREARDVPVVEIVAVKGIEPEQAQVARELPEIGIDHEAGIAQRPLEIGRAHV